MKSKLESLIGRLDFYLFKRHVIKSTGDIYSFGNVHGFKLEHYFISPDNVVGTGVAIYRYHDDETRIVVFKPSSKMESGEKQVVYKIPFAGPVLNIVDLKKDGTFLFYIHDIPNLQELIFIDNIFKGRVSFPPLVALPTSNRFQQRKIVAFDDIPILELRLYRCELRSLTDSKNVSIVLASNMGKYSSDLVAYVGTEAQCQKIMNAGSRQECYDQIAGSGYIGKLKDISSLEGNIPVWELVNPTGLKRKEIYY